MANLTILHAAELRLDAPFSGIGRPPAAVAAVLRDASLAAWAALVECALARNVAAVLLAGGLCDGLERGVRAQARLRDGLLRLAAHGIAVGIVLGPRDPHDGLAVGAWPEGVTVFPPEGGMLVLAADGPQPLTIHGASCPPDSSADDAARRLQRGDAPGLHLGQLPAALAGAAPDAALSCGLEALLSARLDAWALGGTCAPALVRPAEPCIVHASTPQGRGFAEVGPRGASLIDVEDGVVARVVLEPLDSVRCVELTVEADDAADLPAQCGAALARARDMHRDRLLVVAATVSGNAAALRGLRPPDARHALLAALRREADAFSPGVWWARLRAAPPPPLGVAADDLIGEVARHRGALGADAERLAHFLHQRFARLSGAWSATLEPREAAALLDEAAALAAELLASAEEAR